LINGADLVAGGLEILEASESEAQVLVLEPTSAATAKGPSGPS